MSAANTSGMSTQAFDETQHPREQTGKFATKAVSDAVGGLDALAGPATDQPPSYARSADRPDPANWQYPWGAPRFDAITAYDDVAGTYTIGDDLHVRAPGNAPSHWIDTARPVLASLHRAGLTGEVRCQSEGDHYAGAREEWGLRTVLPGSKDAVYFRVNSSFGQTGISVRGDVERFLEAKDFADVDQDELDAAVEDVARAGALIDIWRQQVAASEATRGYAVSRPFYREARGEPGAAQLVIDTSGLTDVVVTFKGGAVAGAESFKAGKPQTGVDREQAMAAVGRAMGLAGGKRAGVPAKVEAMLAAAAETYCHPSVVSLLAARRRARGVTR